MILFGYLGLALVLGSVFTVVVGVLDLILFVALIATGTDLSSAAIALPLIVVGNACVVLMLWRARSSISRLTVVPSCPPAVPGTSPRRAGR